MGVCLPSYVPLSSRDIKQIDQAGRRVLKQIGIRIIGDNIPKYLNKFESAGARVDFQRDIVCFDSEWLDQTLAKAPSSFVLYSRDGKNDLHLGNGNVYFGNGGRVFRILDMATGGYRLSKLIDVAHTATLVDHLDNVRFYIIACQAHDIEQANYHLLDFYSSFNHTTKHVMGGCTDVHGAEQVWKLASIIAGGEERLAEKPFVSVITNSICPLSIETNTLDILGYCTTRGIPVTCAPAPIAGATSPATLAGTLVQMHAEALAGVAFTQVLAPGSKVLYGAVPMTMDLRRMEFSMGSVEMAMMNAAAVQLAKLYSLPIYASGGVTESKRPDIQAGFEKTVSSLAVATAGADFIHLSAGMIDSASSISYEQYVIDDEIIGMTHRMLRGIDVNKDTMALDVIKGVGHGGNFVTEDHTIDHMMDEFFYTNLAVRCSFDIWEERGRPNMLSRAKDQVQYILEDGKEGLLDHALIERIQKAFPGIWAI
ncbi:MAG: trimethylamine methyltransferase family protein [Chloroflexota bacterium]|nr:trimethylamine methyltransferase family protein [Chloroflexota bacterium]